MIGETSQRQARKGVAVFDRAGSGRLARLVAVSVFWAVAALAIAWLCVAQGAPRPAAANRVLRVCADPNDLPFSNRDGEGFENKLAAMIAQAMDATVEYTWWPQREHFLKYTLDSRKCDVVMGWATRSDAVLTTRPYYRSAYALVYRASAPYELHSLDSPLLKKLEIGVHSVGDDWADLPGGAVLAHRGIVRNVRVYTLYSNYSRPNPSADLIEAVAKGDVDVAIAWGPLAGYFAPRQPVELTVVPLAHTHAILPFQFSISLAVRRGDTALRDRLNTILARKRTAIHALLLRYHVPLLPLPAATAKQPAAVASQ